MKKEIDILILLDSKAVDYSSDPRVFRTAYFLWQNGYKVAVLGFQSTPELIQLEEKLTIHNIIPEEIFSFKSIFGKRKEVAQTINNTFSYKYIIANDHLMLSIGRIMKNYNPKSKLIYDSHELFQDYQLEFFNNESFSVKLKSHIWRWIEKKMEKNDVKYADKVIASNDSIAKVFESIFKLKNNVGVIRNIPIFDSRITTQDFQNNFPEVFNLLEENKNTTNLIYFGNYMQKLNGMEYLLEALKELSPNFRLIILGTDKSNGYFDKLIADFKIANRILKINKIPHHYMPFVASYAQISVVPTLYNDYLQCLLSLPNKFLESIKCSLPIVCIDLPEQKKIIKSFNNGFLINETNDNISESIVKGVVEIHDNYDFYQKNALECNNEIDGTGDLVNLVNLIYEYEKGN